MENQLVKDTKEMGSSKSTSCKVAVLSLLLTLSTSFALYQCRAADSDQIVTLLVNASSGISSKKISQSMFGISFEEINHSGAGGLWAELVSNRGFEAGGQNTPSNISPWAIIGDESTIIVSTDRSSPFEKNVVALRMEVSCDSKGEKICPNGGVGVYNPGFWGMNIEQGKMYKATLYVRSQEPIELTVSFVGADGVQTLAKADITDSDVKNWTKKEILLQAQATDHNSRLQLTTTKKGVIWLDQVSAVPLDTHRGHGFREDLFNMLADLKPGFLRFPGGSYVQGEYLINAFRWKQTVGPWEERPGHFNDVWQYWTDDGLGFFEYLELAEDLGAKPLWVFNGGMSINDQVDSPVLKPFVQDVLDALEFAKGGSNSTWGAVRAQMGRSQPFDLQYVAVGNQDCGNKNYRGNYMKFHDAIKRAYADVKIVSNCDGSAQALDHPADLYDVHVYTNANSMFSTGQRFDRAPRNGPKAFVSEYAVTGNDAGKGSLLKALAEAGFLIALEKNGDVVEMASNAPLFANANDMRFVPDAIFFDSSKAYGTPSYYMQQLFKESNGAILLDSSFQQPTIPNFLTASAISWTNTTDGKNYIRIKVVNMGSKTVNLSISLSGLDKSSVDSPGSTITTLTSGNAMDENSFDEPKKVMPRSSGYGKAGNKMSVSLSPYSLISIDLLVRKSSVLEVVDDDDDVTTI